MASFKQHRQHLAPHIGRLQFAGGFDFAPLGLGFVSGIDLFKVLAKFVVQVRRIAWREQGPAAFFHHAAHEEVGDPVGGVHVVRAAAVVASVLAQFQKLFDVQVPCFKIGAHSALALAALVNRDRGVIDNFQERHNAL